jgi:hypothetical protein
MSRHREMLAMCLFAIAASFFFVNGDDDRVHLPGALDSLAPNGLPPTCPSAVLFDVSCPGCGMTRSFIATSRLELDRAFRFNAMGPLLFLLALLQVPYRLYRLRARRVAAWAVSERLRVVSHVTTVLLILGWLFRVLHEGIHIHG